MSIWGWKSQGMKCDDWKVMFENYNKAERCERCNNVFRKNVYKNDGKLWRLNNKVLDHDHKTGLVRNIICQSCNIKLRYIDD